MRNECRSASFVGAGVVLFQDGAAATCDPRGPLGLDLRCAGLEDSLVRLRESTVDGADLGEPLVAVGWESTRVVERALAKA